MTNIQHRAAQGVADEYAASAGSGPGVGTILGVTAAALAAAAVFNVVSARRAERRNPPEGRFVEVDGVHLHYIEGGTEHRGEPPVVLLHGNVVTAEDFTYSGVFDRVARRHRVVAFDRPGMGHSDRPRDRLWTPDAQAELIHKACRRLGIERPIVVGHSLGTMVAMALALDHPEDVRGLVLLSGYYYPTARADVVLAVPSAIPVVGDVLRYTLSPLVGRALLSSLIKGMFHPLPVPEEFQEKFPFGFSVRPWQIRASAEDGTAMIPAAAATQERYRTLKMPVAIITGAEDMVADVGRQSERLHREVPQSTLRVVPGVGHMVHHAVPDEVAEAVETVSRAAGDGAAGTAGPREPERAF